MLPHQKNPEKNDEPFTTVDQEMAKHYRHNHPHYDEADFYGNPAAEEPKDGDDEDAA